MSALYKNRHRNTGPKQDKLSRKILAACLSASFVSQPMAVLASSITKGDGTAYTPSSNVFHIYAQKMTADSKTGVNRFQTYQLDAGNIANMYFNQEGKSVYADNLVNLVGSKIDIGGTVNALKNNQIGGNLFFLSSQGMAVSKGGVINAGSLTVLTPTQSDFDKLNQDSPNADLLKQVVSDPAEVALNKSGTITMEGTVNAPDGVMMRAGKSVTVGDTNSSASIRTGDTDFSKLVNVEGASSGITGQTLAMSKDAKGDIVLEAVSTDTGRDGSADASVTVGGSLKAAGDVSMKATASAAFKDTGAAEKLVNFGKGKITGKLGAALDGDGAVMSSSAVVKVKDTADIQGKDVKAEASSTLSAVLGAATEDEKSGTTLTSKIPAAAVAFADGNNTAKVEMNGKVASTGNLTAKAAADTRLEVGAETATKLDNEGKKEGEEQATANLAYMAVSVVDGSSTAAVSVGEKASLTSSGKADLQAQSTNRVSSSAKANAPDASVVSTAVSVMSYDSSATVDVQGTVQSAGDLTVKADNQVNKNQVKAENGIGSGKQKPKDPNERSFGSTKTGNLILGSASGLKDQVVEGIKDIMPQKLVDKLSSLGDSDPADANKTGFADKMSQYFSAGASVVVADETHKAGVTIGQKGSLVSSGGKADVLANAEIHNTVISSSGQANNQNQDANTKVTADVGFAYSSIGNTASIVTEGTAGKDQVKGTAVSLDARAKTYFNIRKMVDDVPAYLEQLETDLQALGKDFKELGKLKEQFAAVQKYQTSMADSDDSKFVQLIGSVGDALNQMESALDVLGDTISNIGSDVSPAAIDAMNLISAIKAFTSPDSYTTYYVRTQDVDKEKAQANGTQQGSDGSTLGLAGSINLASFQNKASVIVGANSKLTATKGDVSTTAETLTETVSFTGNAGKFFTPNSAANVGVGASVAVQDISGDSLVLVGKDAVLTGENVKVKADNSMNQVGVIYAAGSAGTAGISGMVNLMNGESSSVVSVDDEAALTATKDVNIASTNRSTITGVTGGATLGDDKTTASVGAGLTLINYDVNNIALVADNGSNADTAEKEIADTDSDREKTAKKAANKIAKGTALARKLAGSDASKAGTKTVANTEVTGITAKNVSVTAETSGTINSVAVEAAVLKGDDGSPGAFDGIKNAIGKASDKVDGISSSIKKKIADKIDKVDNYVYGKLGGQDGTTTTDVANLGSQVTDGGTSSTGTRQTLGDQNAETSTGTSVHVAGAGSVALNFLDGETAALTDGAKLTLLDAGAVTTGAEDSLFAGSWAGSGAVNWMKGGSSSGSSNNVSIGGAAAANVIDRDVASILKDTTVTGAGSLTNTAEKSGAEVAAGLGLGIARGDGTGKNVSISAAVSYNEADSDIHALLLNDTVTGGSVTNMAYNKDLQITGGISTSITAGGNGGASVGGTVAISDMDNDLQSIIQDGTYTGVGNVNVDAATNTKQISAAAAVAVSAQQKSPAFAGAVNYSKVDNTNEAAIDGASITSKGTVAVAANDTSKGSNAYETYVQNRGIDTSGATGADDKVEEISEGSTANGGSLMVNAAVSVGASKDTAGVGAAVNVSDVDNTMKARISGSAITANAVRGHADTSSKLISVAGGVGASSKFGGAGSVSWDMLHNDNTVTVENSTIHTGTLSESAANTAKIINVAGQVSAGKAGAGMAMAYNGMSNTTGVYANGLILDGKTADGETGLVLDADNEARIIAIGAGVSAGSEAAVNGSIAVNRGANNTEAVVGNTNDDSTLTNVKTVSVTADDKTRNITVVGSVTGSGTAAVGGGVAYSDIGGSRSGSENAKQKVRAEINHAAITTADSARIAAKASDTARMVTVAVAAGGSGNTAVQGAAAASLINKQVHAGLNHTDIDKDTAKTASVSVGADNNSSIISNATVAAGAGTAAVGAGVAVNRISQSTEASVTGGTQNVAREVVQATGTPDILATGIGGGGAGTAAVAGSFGVNIIDNDVTAKISKATVNSSGNLGVMARSDETIANYAGAVSGAGTAAIGLASTVNTISGDTQALVEDSDVSAAGSDSEPIETKTIDQGLISGLLDSNSFKVDGLKDGRKTEQKKGLVVDSSATHSISSVLASAGGAGTVAVAGTVNVNHIGGSTKAAVSGSDINKNLADLSKADVWVHADDAANSAGLVVNLTGSGTASVGASADTNLIDRTTEASVTGTSSTKKNTANAHDFLVESRSQQAMSNFDATAAFGVEGAAVAGTASIDKLDSTTKAGLTHMDVGYTGQARVTADHTDQAYLGNASAGIAAIGGGVGLVTGIVKENSVVAADVTDSSLQSDENDSKATVQASNTSHLLTAVTSSGVGVLGVGAAGTVAVNNMAQQVTAAVSGSTIKAGSLDILAQNTMDASTNGGSLAGGFGGAGMSVAVNTFNDKVDTVIDSGSQLTATSGALTVRAEEDRDLDQIVANVSVGAAGVGANIMVTNVNKAVDNQDVLDKIDEANDSVPDYSGKVKGLSELEQGTLQENSRRNGSRGTEDETSGVHVKVDGSSLTAAGDLTVGAQESSDAAMNGGSVTVGGASFNGAVGLLNVKHDTQVMLNGAALSGSTVAVEAAEQNKKDGTVLNVVQGSGGVYALGAAYGKAAASGNTQVTAADSTLTGKTVKVSAKDTSTTEANAYGLTAGMIAAGAIVSQAENTSNTRVVLSGSTLEGTGTADSVTVESEKANGLTANAYGGAAGIASGQGVAATAKENGVSTISIQKGTQDSSLKGTSLTVKATTKPAVSAMAGSLSAALLGTASASVAMAETTGTVSVSVGDGTNLDGDSVSLSANTETQDGKKNTEASVKGVSAAGLGSAVVNSATARTNMDAAVTLGKASYKADQGTALSVSAMNTTQTAADARGITVGGLFASGTNLAYTESGTESDANMAAVSLNGDGAQLKSLDVRANGTSHSLTTADGSGGGMISGDLAGAVDNKTYTGSKVTLKGSWDVNGDVAIQSAQTDHMDLNADATKAAVVGTSATKADNTASGAADVVLTGSQITSGGTLTAKADSKANLGQNKTYAVEGSGYGGVAVQGAKLNDTVNRTATVDASNASLTSSGSQILAAESGGKINAAGYIKAAGAGAATWVDVDNNLTSQNAIRTDGKTSLRTDTANGNITLSASDDWAVTAKGVADTQGGAAGGASSDVTNTLTRTNTVDVQGKIYSTNDVNLYAGKDADGALSQLDLLVDSEAYNKTALAVAKPKYQNTLNQSNQVRTGAGSEVKSVRNVDIYADEGQKYLKERSIKYTWYDADGDENFTSTSVGEKSDEISDGTNNYADINGLVLAGVQNKQKLVIGGTGQLVDLDPDELEAVRAYGKGQQDVVAKPDYEASDAIDTSKIQLQRVDYASSLFQRYEELSKLISQYDDSADGTTALQGYVAERTRIFNEMKALGLLSETIDAQGNTVYIPVSGLSVDTIILPDILASGGNITVQAGTLKGSGSLTAQGAPEVTIENHTNLYMKVGDVQAVNPGGEISYNSHSMKTGDTATIRDVNSDKAAAVSLSVTADADSSQGGVISITSDYGTAPLYAAIEGETASKSQKADIEINGSVKAENGVVNVTSNNYSILLQGTDSRTAEVSGKEIHLTAGKSISQGFTDGIVNIGGNPEMQYNGLYQQNKKDYNDAYGFVNTTPIHRQDTTNSEVKDGGGTRIAGDNIYINASDINVNGLIQSGYGSYGVTIEDSAVQSAVATLKKNWNASGQPELSDALVMTGSVYRVVKGGPVLQADGTYAYQPDVFYNPSTDKLVIPDIDAHGGQIYLSGRISSTGNGKIAALDGAYDITVNNNTDTDLQVGKLISNKAEGLISISDSAKNTVTEYRRNSTVVKDLTQWDKAAGDWKVISTGGAQSTYDPLENLRYNWTSGQKVSTTKEYTHTHKAGLWGAVTTLDKTALTKYEQEITPVEKSKQTNYNDNGTYIGVEKLGDSQYVFVYDNVVLNNTRSAVKTRTWRTGFLGWFKWEETKWTTSTGTAQQYVGSVKADHGIHIGFFGNADGNSAIQVASNAGVNLNGNIQSSQSGTGSTISIASKNGAITQDAGLIKGDNVTLQAAKGMENISIESLGDTVRLDALNTGSGDVSISVDGAYGKAGNVDLVQARNQNGDVSLTALGNLTQEGSGVTVEGNRIDLTSLQGSIGTAEQAIRVNAPDAAVDPLNPLSSSLNAGAKQDIYLSEDGDMRVGTISAGGHVDLKATGTLADALPSGDTIDRGNTADLIQGWKDLGLIDGEGRYTDKQAADVAEYKAGVTSEFARYTELKTYYVSHDLPEGGDSQYETLKARYGNYSSADDYLANDTAARSHLADLQQAGAGWKENDLLYAISDAIVNKTTGSTDTEAKQANISGNNITLQAANIGSDKDAEDILVKGITQDDRLDDLKKVVNANSSDVGYTTNDQGEKVFRIYGKVPVGIEANGELNIVSDGNIYVAGRSSGTSGDKELKLGSIQSSNGDIRILGKAGVSNSLTDGSSNLTGNDLILEGGTADIGTADKAVTVDLSGMLNARTDGSLYIDSVGTRDLQLEALYAGKEASLSSAQGIIMSPTAAEQAYLNAGTVLNLSAQNGIGTEGAAIRILDNGAIVNARSVTGDIYLAGKGSGDDSLFLVGTVSTDKEGTVSITAESDLAAGREDGEQPLVSTIDGGTVSLFSSRNLALDNGSLTADTLKLTAGGSVTQKEAHAIKAQTASVDAVSGISLNSGAELESDRKFNAFENVTLKNASDATDVVLGNGGDKGLTVTFAAGSKAKNVTVRNYANGTVNDLAINGPIAAAAGIALTNDEGNLTTTGAMEAESSDIRETAAGGLTNKGSLNAKQDIIQQVGQSIANEANLTAGRDIISTAGKDLTDGGALSAGRNVSLTAGSGSITNGGAVTADQNVTMTAGDSIENQAAVTAAKAALSLTAQKDIAQQGDATAGTSVLMDSQKQGNIAVTGDVTSGTSTALKTKDGSITAGTAGQKKRIQAGTTAALTSETGDITVHGTVTAQEGARLQAVEQGSLLIDGDLLATESGDAEALTNSGDITINGKVESRAGNVVIETLKGDVAVDGQVTAEQGSAKVRSAQGNVKVSGQMKAGTDLMAQSDKGSVTIDGSLTSGRAALARAVDGDVTIGGSVTGGTSVTAQAEEGNITVSGSMEARNGGLTLTASDSRELADKGNISVNGTLTASQAAAVSTDHGSIAIGTEEKDGTVTAGTTAELTSETGDIIVQGTVASRQGAKLSTARKGDILVKGSLLAAESGDAEARTQEGSIQVDGTAEGARDVLLSTARGDAAVTGRVKAGQDVKVSADLGNMTFQGTLEAGRDISVRTGRGNMDFAGSLTSGRDLTAVTEESGNMVFNGLADAGRNFLVDARQEGTITLRKDIRSGMDASFHTNDGSLLFAGVDLSAAEDIHVTADTGSVTLSTTGRGDIKDSHRQANGDRAFVSAPAGNVTIRHTGVGDVDLYSLYAHKDAGVEVADGNLYLDTVNGDLVAVLVKNARKVLDVEHMVAGTGIRMTGADMSVDDVFQRVDSQGNLTLTLDGASEDMPIESLAIGDIKSNTGVRFPRLWLRKGSVQVSEGEFLMDKLMILDKAIFSNGTMVTHVFGTTPVADQAATSVYWNNTRLNRPQEFLGEWRNDNGLSGRWMYLNFDRQGHTQFSNGNLLDLDPHNYVYNQRYSETNWIRTMEDRDFSNFWTPYFHPELTYSNRYDLVDGSRAVVQPDSTEITVEEV
ncbi:leukotoxin LktA family filamentous adhesin [uncultured Acidaminococcus sp.]|uniref:leukotoxin LktA family filamentous adhesin n=1 Tax=uncultured Acidaminococcus sp. TaxID=352152 RepID=UPI00265FBF55|nr:leukotoxin LktA family filamentous adhesin [uncultured Acidaminococcus sp.]